MDSSILDQLKGLINCEYHTACRALFSSRCSLSATTLLILTFAPFLAKSTRNWDTDAAKALMSLNAFLVGQLHALIEENGMF